MITKIAYIVILGQPLIFYLGILSLISLLLTASIGYTTVKGYRWIPFKYHPAMALTTVILATIHGLMGLAAYFNF